MKISSRRLLAKLFQNILVTLASLLLLFVVFETALRIVPYREVQVNNPYRFTKVRGEADFGVPFHSYSEVYPLRFDKRRYYQKSNGVINYYFNQLGARWVGPEKQKLQRKNALVVGDSLTYGFGVRYEDTYIFKLQNLLEEERIYMSFINFSVPASSSKECLEIYMREKEAVPHEVLIYGLHLNDLIAFPTSYVISDFHIYRWDIQMREKSKLVDFVLRKIEKIKTRHDNIQQLTSLSNFETDYFVNNMNAIKQMSLEAKKKNVRFFVVILPILADVRQDTFRSVYNKIRELFAEHNIESIDLTSSVMPHKDSDLWILPFDQHPNELANAPFAQKLHYLLKDVFAKEDFILQRLN